MASWAERTVAGMFACSESFPGPSGLYGMLLVSSQPKRSLLDEARRPLGCIGDVS